MYVRRVLRGEYHKKKRKKISSESCTREKTAPELAWPHVNADKKELYSRERERYFNCGSAKSPDEKLRSLARFL